MAAYHLKEWLHENKAQAMALGLVLFCTESLKGKENEEKFTL